MLTLFSSLKNAVDATLRSFLCQAREIQAHLSALRSLCRGLLEKVRAGPDPEEPKRKRGQDWREVRARNRLRALNERDEVIAREQRCVTCMVNVRT